MSLIAALIFIADKSGRSFGHPPALLRRTMAPLAQTKGNVKDVHATYSELMAPAETGGSIVKAKNLVRFGTMGVWDDPQVIVPQGQGA